MWAVCERGVRGALCEPAAHSFETNLKLGDAREAFRAYLKAAELDPENIDAQLKLTTFYVLGKKPEEARKLLEPLRTERGSVSRAAITAIAEIPDAEE